MGYDAKVLADSLSPEGVRLTTVQATYPHAVHKDLLTHCALARNSRSFRATPPEVLLEEIRNDPFLPEVFGHRVKGMGQRNEPIEGQEAIDQELARALWMEHLESALRTAECYLDPALDIAKQQINFILQDFCWITTIFTATEWDNFWALRADVIDPMAMPRPEVFKIANMMKGVYDGSIPEHLEVDQWHMPLVDRYESQWCWEDDDTLEWNYWKKVSVGRCARVSYLTHDGKRDHQRDVELHDRLLRNGHMSPFEHVATPLTYWTERKDPGINPASTFSGKFRGWHQFRKDIPYEWDFGKMRKSIRV